MEKENKKEIKKLFDFNQDAKNIFSIYSSSPDNIIVGDSILNRGEHFITNGYYLSNSKDYIERFNSVKIYDYMKNYKKIINKLCIDNFSSIYFDADGMGTELNIGYCSSFDLANSGIKDKLSAVKEYLSVLSNPNFQYIEMGQEGATKLVGNGIIDLESGKYKTRISRELIPGLKKKDYIYAAFLDTDDKNLFKVVLKAERQTSKCTSYHIYTAIYI